MTSVTPTIARNHLKAEYIADILWHIYGDATDTLLDGVQTTFSKSFDQSAAMIFKSARRRATPRDGDGDGMVFDGTPHERPATPEESSTRFKRKNSDARIAEIHASVEQALNGERTSKSANELTDMLSELTVKELRDIKIKYGMSASGRTKAEFVAKIAKRLDSGRRKDQSVDPGIKLSAEDKYWLQPLMRVHTENRSSNDEQRIMVEAVVGGKALSPVQKTKAIELFQRKYNELNSTLGVGGNRQGENQSKAVESVLRKLGVDAQKEWKDSVGAINKFPQVPKQSEPQSQSIAPEPLPTRDEVRASLPPMRSAADRAARARAEIMAARASQSDKPVVAPMPVVAKPVSSPPVMQYSEDQIMQRQVIDRAERALAMSEQGRWSGPDISQETIDSLYERFPNAAPRGYVAKALFSRAMMLKDVRDADGDGKIFDGTPQERPAAGYADRLLKMRERRGENSHGVSIAVTESPEFKQWFGDSKVVDENGKPKVLFHSTTEEFSEFKNPYAQSGIAMFTTNPEYSNLHMSGQGKTAQSMPVYIQAEKPLDLRTIPSLRSDAKHKLTVIMEDAAETGTKEQQDAINAIIPKLESERDIYMIVNRSFRSQEMKDLLYKAGFDSIVMNDNRKGVDEWTGELKEVEAQSWVVFDSNKIKSAIGNSGKFSRDSGDIRKSVSSAIFTRAASEKDGDGDGLTADGTPQERPVSQSQPEQKPQGANVAPLPQRDDRLRTRDKITDAIVGTLFGVKKDIEGINNAVKPREGVAPEQEQAYRAVLNDALKQMPPGMVDNIGKNLKSVEMHKDMWSITKEVHERDGEEYNGKSITFGFFDPRSGSVHLDGTLPEGLALKSGGEFSQRGLYAHELAHAADKLEDGTYFSKSKAWNEAYASEINTDATPLSKYARVSPSEGFAEFVRYATENPQEARKNFPQSMKSVESRYGRM